MPARADHAEIKDASKVGMLWSTTDAPLSRAGHACAYKHTEEGVAAMEMHTKKALCSLLYSTLLLYSTTLLIYSTTLLLLLLLLLRLLLLLLLLRQAS